MTGVPLASAQCQGRSSTVTWMCPIRGDTASAAGCLCLLQARVSLTRFAGSEVITLYFTSMLPVVANEYGHT
jgi:hypothetical protein